MSDELFREKLLERLNIATSDIINKIVEEIFAVALESADFPTKWPIEITNENIEDIVNCPRMFDKLIDKIGEHGLSICVGIDNIIAVDIIDVDDDAVPVVDDDVKEPKKIMTAKEARGVSNDNIRKKLVEIYNFVATKISKEAESGGTNVGISLSDPPISKNTQMIKKLIKTLTPLGYKVLSDNKAVDSGAKSYYYDKIKEFNICWKK